VADTWDCRTIFSPTRLKTYSRGLGRLLAVEIEYRQIDWFGFTANVRHPLSPPFHSRDFNVVWAVQLDLERAFFRTRHSIPPLWIADILTSSTIIEEITRMSEAGLASIANFYFDFRDSSKQDNVCTKHIILARKNPVKMHSENA
jgi:hypothetical protein